MGQAALIPCCTLVATIKVLESPIEGCFIVTIDNLIFEVKGIVHPMNRIIAYLRYIPSIDSDSGFKKVYNLEERENYLKENYPDYLWYNEQYGRMIQSVSINKIESILDPVDYLAQLRGRNKITNLEQVSVTLAKKLVETTEIDWRDIGLTGSQLIGVAGKDSDIDLVIYGSSACRKFYSNLSARINGIPEIERYSGKLLEDHVSFRWGAHNELRSILLEIERDKLLQGLIGNYHFFIRLVKTPNDLDYDYGDLSYQMLGHQKVSGKVIDSSDSIFTPCEYQVKCVSSPNLEKLVSYRGRYTEHVSAEDKFEAFGRLELVMDHKVDSQYMQLVLGELPSDYLIPIK